MHGDDAKLGDVLKELAETTTVHGVPKIVASKHMYQKVVWILMLLLTSGYLMYQLSKLGTAYYSRPIKTTVSLEFENLKFPAITVCNMNPIKKHSLTKSSSQIQRILDPTTKVILKIFNSRLALINVYFVNKNTDSSQTI